MYNNHHQNNRNTQGSAPKGLTVDKIKSLAKEVWGKASNVERAALALLTAMLLVCVYSAFYTLALIGLGGWGVYAICDNILKGNSFGR